jgi:hypothetical protein
MRPASALVDGLEEMIKWGGVCLLYGTLPWVAGMWVCVCLRGSDRTVGSRTAEEPVPTKWRLILAISWHPTDWANQSVILFMDKSRFLAVTMYSVNEIIMSFLFASWS